MIPNRIVPPDRIARSQPVDTLATSLKFTTMHHAHRAAFHSRPRMVCIVDLAGVIPVNILQRTIHYRVRGQCWSLSINVIVDIIGAYYPRRMAKGHATRKKTSESGLGPDLRLKCIPNECPPTSPAGAGVGASMLGGGRPGKILKTPNVQLRGVRGLETDEAVQNGGTIENALMARCEISN
ncbi:hypothetical protein ALC60_14444 [Trachymyrmex zeteki]|uniref:Uncharacterized protein n=1 Tax=Mycetomoellerius zeteki TaxID=64791 RepID=A0A151WFA0_9HYME|nr:hypothetical protein ALC60_14444 [Trachymyrmex zeteki]